MSGKTIAGLTGLILTLVTVTVAALGLAGGGLAIAACAAPTGSGTPLDPTAADAGRPAADTRSPEQAAHPNTTIGQHTAVLPDACRERQRVLARAEAWLTAWHGGPVPYESSSNPATWFGGYRRDCSGYASMALGLAGPGLNTAGLAAQSTPIPKIELSAGDLLINPAPGGAGHVVIFDHWTDATMTSYIGYEQSGSGTHHRTIPYSYFAGYPMSPFRYN
jgi:hypothetical protein